ncbi:MAG: mobility-associated LCxxNW protein [Acinetobacter sp.]
MTDYCAFSKDHRCIKYADHELTRFELAEADQLCHGNWIEIQNLQNRIDLLEQLLKDAGIEIPLE